MLEEFVEASAAVMNPAAAPPLASPDISTVTANGPSTTKNAKLPLQILHDVIHKELESRRTAVVARKATLEAEERAAKEKESARGTGSGGSGGSGVGRSAMGIAEQHHGASSSAMAHSANSSVVRQHQLEKMVKALVARQEKVHSLSSSLQL